jgi:hypothetical protein
MTFYVRGDRHFDCLSDITLDRLSNDRLMVEKLSCKNLKIFYFCANAFYFISCNLLQSTLFSLDSVQAGKKCSRLVPTPITVVAMGLI